NVIQNGLTSYTEGVQRTFPQDPRLPEMNVEGYAGVPLVDSNFRCLGLICIFTRQPLANRELAEALLRICASRAAAELQRQAYEESLARGEERLRSLAAHGNEAVLFMKLEVPIPLDASEDETFAIGYQHAYVADCNDQAARLFGFPGANALIGKPLEA